MQKVSWFFKFSAVTLLALVVAVAALGTGYDVSANSAAAATPAATAAAAAAPSFPMCYTTAQIAKVRLVHASPNSPAVDIYMDGAAKPTLAKVAYEAVADYMEVAAGTHHVKITAAGDAKTVVWESDVTVSGLTAYTLIAEGTIVDKTFTVSASIDDASDTAGKVRIVAVHLVPDGGSADILVDGKAVATGLDFGKSVELNIDAPAKAVHIQVTKAGDPKTVLIDLPNTTLKADTIYTILATGLVGTNKADKAVKLKAVVLTSASFAGFKPPPTPTPVPTAAATTAATAAAPAPAATAAATAAAPAPTATSVPVGLLANAGWVLRTSKAKQLNGPKCVEVAAISIAHGPAASIGIKAGDYILGIDGKPLAVAADFEKVINAHKSGDTITVTFQHVGSATEQTLPLVLGANPYQ